MIKRRNWYTRAIHLMVALAFLLGLAIVPGIVTAQMTAPTLVPPDIAYNVKGSVHKVCIDWDDWSQDQINRAQLDWWLEAGVDLNPNDITVLSPTGQNPNIAGNVSYAETIKTIGTIDNPYDCIEIRSMRRGDIHIFVKITLGAESWTLHTEKKWGELCCTELDVDPDTAGVQHTHDVTVLADETGLHEEVITDWVTASFLHVPGCVEAGHAIVHWWLFEDTDANQDYINALMDYLAANDPEDIGCDPEPDYWSACGKYKVTDDFLGGKQPWDYINDYALTHHADTNIFDWDYINPGDDPGELGEIWAPGWYAWNESEDYVPGDVAGRAEATLTVDTDQLEPCNPEKVMIVVLVSYPSGSTPQDDPHNGENIVCVEKGKKEFHKKTAPEIDQVKTPQLRWAGEKIVLEKEWPYEPYFEEWDVDLGSFTVHYIDLAFYAAVYSLEEGSIGNLEPISDAAGVSVDVTGTSGIYIGLDYLGLPAGAQQVICPLGGYYYDFTGEPTEWGGYAGTQAILVSQQSGQADVNAALYEVRVLIEIVEGEIQGTAIEVQANGPIMNHGFLVYFLEFEDVTLAEDITPWDSLTGLDPEEEDGYVAVQVRGFFDYRHSHLPATLRPEQPIDYDGDGVMDVMLPEGRYVLPDDWWLLAGTKNINLRPNFDLMDQADLDTIVSPVDINLDHDEELGPYDDEVRTTEPTPGEAQYPTIGPFSTYQLWSTEDMWITEATVPSSIDWWPFGWRNTVVPDGEINWYDAPMPQALVIFDIVDYSTTMGELPSLSELDKGDLEGYGFEWFDTDDKIYQSPYYAVEIPANWQIPPGYNWRSWMRDPAYYWWYIPVDGPYDFWTDLQLESIISNTYESPIDPWDVEVYSDNHGIAGVTVDYLDNMGLVTITATAEYPYILRGKYGPRVSEEIDIIWGPAFVHLDADFEADPREGDAPLTVDFDPVPWTIGGTAPYTDLHWDFGDGYTEDVSGSWTLATLPPTTHTYTTDGVYTVSLTVTDSTPPPVGPMVDICEKVAYINVGAVGPCDPTPSPEEGFADLIAEGKLVIVYNFDPFTTEPTAVGGWTWYDPTLPAGQNNLDELSLTTAYWVKVTENCYLTYGTKTYHLAAGWNNPVWLGC